jgi:geranylgeranyl diphosphate synthase type II
MNFKEEQDNRVRYIESVIKGYLPTEEGYQKTIFEAMNYSILAGGKRLRPMLMLETYRLFGGIDTVCMEPFMAAIEMIHTYSLVHDDLPAMDNDEYRRGRKTTHIVFGEAMGILAGDGLLNYAFETACKVFSFIPEVKMNEAAKAMKILAQKAGVFGMIGGQVIDIEGCNHSKQNSFKENEGEGLKDRLNQMYRLKTSALIEASMMIGAVLAGAKEQELNVVEEMAGYVGLAFQIQDDILDETSTTEVLGKPIHSDARNEKVTYVTLMGIEKAKQEVTSLTNKGLSAFEVLGRKNDFLQELIRKLITREN